MEMLKEFYQEEEGMGTVEMVMLIAALMCIALIFKDTITSYAKKLMSKVFSVDIEAPEGGDQSHNTGV